MKKINVCLSPELVHLYKLENTIVVVTDIFRATSCMVTGLAHGVASITPVATVTECKELQNQGYIAAAERDAHKVEGFQLDNSPFSYMDSGLKNKEIAMTTTNGTLSISKVKNEAFEVLIGAFLNIGTVASYLNDKPQDVLILCAGWKGEPCLEDTLFAGALVSKLAPAEKNDSALMALRLFNSSNGDLLSSLEEASHRKRLGGLGITKDIEFCLEFDKYPILPILVGNKLKI